MNIYLHKIKHKLWESYKYNPPIKYKKIKFFTETEHTFNVITNSKKKKIIEFEQILLLSGQSLNYELMLNSKANLIERLRCDDIRFLISPTNIAKENALHYLEDNKLISDKIKIIYPSINENRFKVFDEQKSNLSGRVKLLFIGQKFYGKGVPICLRIAEILNKKKIDFHFKLVCRDIPKNIKVPKNVEILNSKISENFKYELYDWCHLFIFPVVQDSFGVYLECLETNTPIISTNIYDKKDIITNNKTGVLIDTPLQLYEYKNFGIKWKDWNEFQEIFNDNFLSGVFENLSNKFVEKIEIFLNNPFLFKNMKKNISHETIERFHPNIKKNALIDLYKKI